MMIRAGLPGGAGTSILAFQIFFMFLNGAHGVLFFELLII